MAKKVLPTYNEKINEFTDWVNGNNYLTQGNDTENKPVSGEKIRLLLLEKLLKPIFIYRDKEAHLYRVFSSEDAKNIWDSDKVKYADLEITNFVAPSEYSVKVNITSGSLCYIRDGVKGLSGSKIKYTWETSNDKGDVLKENMSVTYTIRENGKVYPTIKTTLQTNVEEDMFEYLSTGVNTIDITFKGITTGAEKLETVIIYVIKLDIESTFDYSVLLSNLNTLSFNIQAIRNDTGPLTFKTCRHYYGNSSFNSGTAISTYNDFSIPKSLENNLNPSIAYEERGTENQIRLKSGLHSVLVWGEMEKDGLLFHSNLLYYVFCTGYEGTPSFYNGIAFKCNLNDRISLVGSNEFQLSAVLYEQITLDWAFIRYDNVLLSKEISWFLRDENEEDNTDYTEYLIGTYNCTSNLPAPILSYIPTIFTEENRKTYLVARTTGLNPSTLMLIPIHIEESSLGISETGGLFLKLKLSAYGKLNGNSDYNLWNYSPYSTTFTGVKWNDANGWYDNSLRLSGIGSTAVINYNPFLNPNVDSSGITVEIEFESEYISSNNDELIRIGDSENGPHISIYPNKALMFISGNPIITTNYKANERVKLAFIVEPKTGVSDELKNVIFIVNNGIVERAAGWIDYNSSVFNSNIGNIKIGGCESGIRVYNIRTYSQAITITNEYNNYVYDSDDKAKIVARNNIYKLGEINLGLALEKIDVIIIKGHLSKLLSRLSTKDLSKIPCDIERICIGDDTKNFTVTHGQIRKHGQSTLNYPITSYKIWTWSSVDDTRPSMVVNASSDLLFTKNRYLMKNDAIPANKFVLQANYADSSGVHNGGFERLIQDIWFNTRINGEYKLRTQPLLFTTNQTISPQVWTVDNVTFGDTEMTTLQSNLFSGKNELGKLWKDYFGEVPFPYTIRNSPDSFPCLVFYLNLDNDDEAPKFLGLYVFMDDKKSDFVYGERSIYKVDNVQAGTSNSADPFCVKSDSVGNEIWDEKSGTKIWNNDNVLRIEVLSASSTLADYRGYTADNSGRRFDNVVLGTTEKNTSIGWEEDFELIYPDKKDITTKVGGVSLFDPLKFITKVIPFTNWLNWIIGTYNNLSKFEAEAAAHLDLYKLAAYYIFVLRFGLVDSLERNAQIKTYDGVHFHYEPWDMDIALGNRNTGGIAFEPPVDRYTLLDEKTGAISGRSKIDTNHDDIADTWVSNWLWDALEAWPFWMDTIVKDTADAMFDAGLTYNNVIEMLDNEYQDKWCESIYNESGLFKYVINRQKTDENGNILPGYDDGWLAWLLGARTTHRHWWLKTSMDYYDAKWGIGEFTRKTMYLACEMHNVNGTINLMPTSDTYFAFKREATKFGPYEATALNGYQFDTSIINSGAKVPFIIQGANFIKEIDISDIASGLLVFSVANAYSSEVGPVMTKVNIGVPITLETSSHMEGSGNSKGVTLETGNTLNAIEELNIRGLNGLHSLSFLSEVRTINKLYAAGSGLNALISATGTDYNILELPDTLTSITFNSTTWNINNISFWSYTPSSVVNVEREVVVTDAQGNTLYEEDGITPQTTTQIVLEISSASYDKYDYQNVNINTSIPRSLTSVVFRGTTGNNACARQFVVDWINSIIHFGTEDWNNDVNGIQEQTITIDGETSLRYPNLEAYLTKLFNDRSLTVENIYWGDGGTLGLSFEQLKRISLFNNIDYENWNQSYQVHPNVINFAKGYLVMSNEGLLNGELTELLVSLLTTWFGDGVFTINSGGLVIDQIKTDQQGNPINYTVISVGPKAYNKNGEIWLNEGDRARISATYFKLSLRPAQSVFSLSVPGDNFNTNSNFEYPANSHNITCTISEQIDDGDYYYYLNTVPSTTGTQYDVQINSGGNHAIVRINPLKYPEDITFTMNALPKTSDIYLSNIKYYKDENLYVLSGAISEVVFGLKFKEDADSLYEREPQSQSMAISNLKFKLYRNDLLCSKFENGLEDSYFTTINGDRIAENADAIYNELSFYKNYLTGYDYKYYIPLKIENVPVYPLVYRIEATFKIGGKTETVSLSFVVCNDILIATDGPKWGLLNYAYTLLFGRSYDTTKTFTAGICSILTGRISTSGTYLSLGNMVSVSDNANGLLNLTASGDSSKSMLLFLPNITEIDLDGASSVRWSLNGVVNLDLSRIKDLRKLYILNCSLLNTDIDNNSTVTTTIHHNIDLTGFPDITEVDASGTSINVLVPLNAKLTKYELGSPTSISIINPTVLTPEQIKVDNYANLNSLELINIPNVKSFNMFGKITRTIGAEVLNNTYLVNGAETSNGSWKSTTPIYNVSQDLVVTLSTTGDNGVYVYTYNSSDVFVRGYYVANGSVTLSTLQANNPLSYIRLSFGSSVTAITITDSTTGQVIFKYET